MKINTYLKSTVAGIGMLALAASPSMAAEKTLTPDTERAIRNIVLAGSTYLARQYAKENPNATIAFSAQYFDNGGDIPSANSGVTSSDPFAMEGGNLKPLSKVAALIPNHVFEKLIKTGDNYIDIANQCNINEARQAFAERGEKRNYSGSFLRQELVKVDYGVAKAFVDHAFDGEFDKKSWDVFPGRGTEFYLQLADTNNIMVDARQPGVKTRIDGQLSLSVPVDKISLDDICSDPRN